MSDLPTTFDPTGDPEQVLAAGPPEAWLATLPFAERATALAADALGAILGQGWLFPPVGAPGVVRWLFGHHTTDAETGAVLVSVPLGVVTVGTDDSVDVEWRIVPDPTTDTTVVPPPADRPPVPPAAEALPVWHLAALDAELSALAPTVAAAIALGDAIDADVRARLDALLGFLEPLDLLDQRRALDPSATATPLDAAPAPDPERVAGSLVLASPFASTVAMSTPQWRRALQDAGADATVALGTGTAGDPEPGDDDRAVQARALGPVLGPLADPDWVVRVQGLAGPGTIDLWVAITAEPSMWTAVCHADDTTMIGGPASADAVRAIVRDALDADALGPEGPTHLALPGAAADLFAALADGWASQGDAAFDTDVEALAATLAAPAIGSWTAALRHLRPTPTSVRAGVGNAAIAVGTDGLELHAQTRVFARRLGRPVAILAVLLDDRHHPDGSAVRAGHVFVRTADRLWTLSPQAAWPSVGGVGDDDLISLAALGGADLDVVIRTLLGA